MARKHWITLAIFGLLIAGGIGYSNLQAAGDADLAKKVADLEAKLAALEKRVESMAPPTQEMENQARLALNQINTLMSQGKHEQAKAQMADFKKKYARTQAFKAAARVDMELQVFGRPVPAKWGVEKWYQGESDVDFSSDSATLLVFWEEWCPHCKREVPKMQALFNKFNPKGLQMVGLTKVTKSSTEDKVTSFISSQNVKYPMAKEDGTLSQHFGVQGIPAAAVVKDGKVVWRGHPARLTESMIEGWL